MIPIATGAVMHPRLERRVAEHELEVLGQQERRAEQREVRERDRGRRRREPRVLEEAQVEHRVVGVQLPPDEHAEEERARTPNAAITCGSRPAQVGRLDDAEQSRPSARRSTAPRRSGRARPRRDRASRARRRRRARSRSRQMRHVDEEHRAPPEVLEQQPAAERADRDAEPGDTRPRCRWPGPAPGP